MTPSTAGTIADLRVREFLARNANATAERLPDGTWVVRLSNVALSQDLWSKANAGIGFLIPSAFPMARPDCFIADQDLRHKNGTMPANALVNAQPHFGTVLWFSYHPQAWDVRSTVDTYYRLILRRLNDPR